MNCLVSSPVTNGHSNLLSESLFEHLVCSVGAPAGTVLPVDLEHLVPESQANQRGRRICLDQLNKYTLENKKITVIHHRHMFKNAGKLGTNWLGIYPIKKKNKSYMRMCHHPQERNRKFYHGSTLRNR